MTDEAKIVVEQNPCNGKWDVGWRFADGEFTPQFCGYATKEEAEAEIPGFDARVEEGERAYQEKRETEERAQNKQWPNVGYVRARIQQLIDSGKPENIRKAFDASDKLDWLLELDKAEHIRWPLPSWKAIKSGRVY